MSIRIGICRNRYMFFDESGDRGQWVSILDGDTDAGPLRGRSYIVEVMRIVESQSKFNGLTFYISKLCPDSLPSYGKNVVLFIIGDEHFRSFPYFRQILAIVRCMGSRPLYLDGWPTNLARMVAVLFFLHKLRGYLNDLWRTTKFRRSIMVDIDRRTLHVPLGYLGNFNPKRAKFASRKTDYTFVGSIVSRKHAWYSPLGFLRPPKFRSRSEMLKMLSFYAATRENSKGIASVTADFKDSASRFESYVQGLANCKISVCPRGSNQETYRFNESCKAGCIVICEPIPDVWFHEGHPGIVVKNWRDLPAVIDKLLASPAEMERLSDASFKFWESHLSEKVAADKIAAFITTLLLYDARPVAESLIQTGNA